jgi:tetratricopeptide (TPR) repeat protein
MLFRLAVISGLCVLAQAESQPGWRSALDRAVRLRDARSAEAERTFSEAAAMAKQVQDGGLALALVWHGLALEYQAQGRHDDTERLLRQVLAQYVGKDTVSPLDHAAALHALAVSCRTLERTAEAESLHRTGISIVERRLGSKHPALVLGLGFLGILLTEQGRGIEASEAFTRSIRLGADVLGASHPDLATSLMGTAALQRTRGDFAAARQLATRALRILETAYGPDDLRLTGTLNELAQSEVGAGRIRSAAAYWRRGLEITRKWGDGSNPDALAYQVQLADAEWWEGRYAQADELFARTVAAAEQLKTRAVLGFSLHHWAASYAHRKNHHRAEELFRRALQLTESGIGARNSEWAVCAVGLARTLLALERTEEGEYWLGSAIAAAEQVNTIAHPIFLGALQEHARILHSMKRKDEAKLVAKRLDGLIASGAGRAGGYTVSLTELKSSR